MKKISSLLAILLVSTTAHSANLLTPASSSISGTVNNPTVFADGLVPAEATVWTSVQNTWWTGTSSILQVDLGDAYTVDDITVSVDNNDNYSVEWSLDSSVWNNLFDIDRTYGEIRSGMDTMSTIMSNPEYISSIDFAAIQAQYIRIFATGGDNRYSVGELSVYGHQNVSAVPLPATALMFIPALLGFIGLRRKANA